ncbi:Mitogen-activated protein kinase kinase kinase 2 [Diplonema papillatum]|nr:Mitogen-activated protein kinase kinase kinase 2 [Diplonema papillatum]
MDDTLSIDLGLPPGRGYSRPVTRPPGLVEPERSAAKAAAPRKIELQEVDEEDDEDDEGSSVSAVGLVALLAVLTVGCAVAAVVFSDSLLVMIVAVCVISTLQSAIVFTILTILVEPLDTYAKAFKLFLDLSFEDAREMVLQKRKLAASEFVPLNDAFGDACVVLEEYKAYVPEAVKNNEDTDGKEDGPMSGDARHFNMFQQDEVMPFVLSEDLSVRTNESLHKLSVARKRKRGPRVVAKGKFQDASTASDLETINSQGTSTSKMSSDILKDRTARKVMKLQGQNARQRTITVSVIEMDASALRNAEAIAFSQVWAATLLECIKASEGVTVVITGSSFTATWNAHKANQTHAVSACRCALDFNNRFTPGAQTRSGAVQWKASVATGCCRVAFFGSDVLRAPTVTGEAVTLANQLGTLAWQVGAKVVLSHGTYNSIRDSVIARPVDAIPENNEGLGVVVIYELLSLNDITTLPPPANDEGRPRSQHSLESKSAAGDGNVRNPLASDGVASVVSDSSFYAGAPPAAHAHHPPPRRAPSSAAIQPVNSPWSAANVARIRGLVSRHYIDAFAAMRRGDWDLAKAEFLVYLEDHPGDRQAIRQLRLATMFKQEERYAVDGYVRHFVGWEDYEEQAESVNLPEGVHLRGNAAETLVLEVVRDMDIEEISKLHGKITEAANIAVVGTRQSQEEEVPSTVTDTRGNKWLLLGKVLGSGAFGKVRMGMSADGCLVAVKTMSIIVTKAQEIVEEVSVMRELRHDNAITYLGSGLCNSTAFVVMEWVCGGSLKDVLKSFGCALPASIVKRYACDILRGLAYLHKLFILHRDLKPHNVLLTAEGTCKLADFGASAKLSSVVRRQEVVGTPMYMAPEACKGSAVEVSDIWSFGITVCQLLTYELPYVTPMYGHKVRHFMQGLAHGSFEPQIPPALRDTMARDFVQTALNKDICIRPTAQRLLQHRFLL